MIVRYLRNHCACALMNMWLKTMTSVTLITVPHIVYAEGVQPHWNSLRVFPAQVSLQVPGFHMPLLYHCWNFRKSKKKRQSIHDIDLAYRGSLDWMYDSTTSSERGGKVTSVASWKQCSDGATPLSRTRQTRDTPVYTRWVWPLNLLHAWISWFLSTIKKLIRRSYIFSISLDLSGVMGFSRMVSLKTFCREFS